MAAILKTNDKKLPYIYNISQGVGFNKPNLLDDVQLIQVIFSEITPYLGVGVLRPYPSINGIYDTITGFWVYQLQKMMHCKVDGLVSPVVGSDGYTGGKLWTLFGLNQVLKSTAPQRFDKLYQDPRLSVSLRNSIKPPTNS